ncbi:hypothetical protein RYH73_07810 [Olivibacter sp. CPCC 100613]|uniref:hypothetical protein n=1 Tax=Olivibacter sp. CPCC 100613 TaxID=3079931 RepID=UPI002FF58570
MVKSFLSFGLSVDGVAFKLSLNGSDTANYFLSRKESNQRTSSLQNLRERWCLPLPDVNFGGDIFENQRILLLTKLIIFSHET